MLRPSMSMRLSIAAVALLVASSVSVSGQEETPRAQQPPPGFGELIVTVLRDGKSAGGLRVFTKEELKIMGWVDRAAPGMVGFWLPADHELRTSDDEVVSGIDFCGDRLDDVARVLVAVLIPKEGEENRYYHDRDKLRHRVVETYDLAVGEEVVVKWLQRAGYSETVRLRAGETWD